jgi:hypothetical protein
VGVLCGDAPDIRPDNAAFFISGIRSDIALIALPESGKAGYRISGRILQKSISLRPDIRYPAFGLAGYPVSGFWFSRISGIRLLV